MADLDYLDWPFFDDAHRALKSKLDDWCEAHRVELGRHDGDVDAVCGQLVRLLGRSGWLGYCVPQAYRGSLPGLDVRTLSLVRETLAYHGGLADFAFAMQGLGSAPISFFGTEAQRRRYLPDVALGRRVAAFALSEKTAGSDVAALATTATAVPGGYVLDGEKTWISNGGIADFYVVFARTGEGPGARGLSAFLVDADHRGLEIAERIEVIAPHPLATLRFHRMELPEDSLIGAPGAGFKVAMTTLDTFRTTVGAAALGLARRALDEALDHATRRELFGAPLAELQLSQAALAEMALAVDTSALAVYRAGWRKDGGAARVTREASMAKLHATESAQAVVDRAVQLHGGLGVTRGEMVERLYREVRALRIYEGASEVQKVVIARQELARRACDRDGGGSGSG